MKWRRNRPNPANVERDQKIAEARLRGEKFKDIAKTYGVTESRAYFIAKRIIDGPTPGRIAEEARHAETERMAELYRAGKSGPAIAREFGVHRQVVYQRMHNAGIKAGVRPIWDRLSPKIYYRPSGCWLWLGKRDSNGYGRLLVGGKRGKEFMAHRLVYEHLIGPISPKLVLDHLCRTAECVNPWHCEPIEHLENLRRGVWRNAVSQSPLATRKVKASEWW